MIPESAEQYYRISDWGAGFFHGGDAGHLWLTPTKKKSVRLDLYHLVREIRAQGYATPLKFHFPQMLDFSIGKLSEAFRSAAAEFHYSGSYTPIYPIKANPAAPVVKAILAAGKEEGIGLEAGSIAELAAIMSVAEKETPLVCNGYKDKRYMRLILHAAAALDRVFLVIEKFSELHIFLAVIRELKPDRLPFLGIRARLHARGTGKWEESGGDFAKFGLTASEIVAACTFLKEQKLISQLRLLHAHIGSQVTHSRKIKGMVEEAGMTHAELIRMDIPIEIVDLGGGLGVDYDGSRSSGEFSINYTITEYANNLVFHMKGICEQQDVPEPVLFTESGRSITAYHSMLIVDVLEKHSLFQPMPMQKNMEGEDKLLVDLLETYQLMNARNLIEYFHDAIHMKEQLHTLFGIGVITLEQKALGEQIFWNIVRKAIGLAPRMSHRPEELEMLDRLLASKYVTNFSIFRSVPDAGSIGQIFPIAPIHRLDEVPVESAIIADITCDSDGKINRFADISTIRNTLKFHRLKNEPYYLGIFLTGAYQDVMGNAHNLFGNPDSFFISVTGDNLFEVLHHIPKDSISDMLRQNGYLPGAIAERWGKETVLTKLLEGNTYLDKIPDAGQESTARPVTVSLEIDQLNCPRCQTDIRAILSDLSMINEFNINGNILHLAIATDTLIPHLKSLLAQAGFTVNFRNPGDN